MVTHIFFDAGNTLVYLNMELISTHLAARGARVTTDQLWQAEHRARLILDDPVMIRTSNDHTRSTRYFTEIFRFAGVTDPPTVQGVIGELQAIHRTNNLWEVVPPEIPSALRALRARYKLSVISNANGTVREKLRRVGLASYFEVILDSHEEGIEKPDPRIFRAALERTGAKAERSLYVGDYYHIDVAGARAAGMKAVLIDPGGFHEDKPVPRIPTIASLEASIDAL